MNEKEVNKSRYNLIYNGDKDITIGYWNNLIDYLGDGLKRMINERDWDSAYELIDEIKISDIKADPNKLYVMSDNNGMGLTIKEWSEK